MSPTKVLLGQIAVVFGIVTLALMMATQWTAASLGYQAELGRPWTVFHGVPLYQPWQFFLWWFQFDAYAPDIFQRGAFVAASGGIAGALAAIIGSVWRARQAKLVTTYGSARWASPRDLKRSGLLNAAGVFLGRADEHYLRHDGPEHVMAFAPTRSGKGVGLVIPTLLSWTGSAVIHDIKGENFAVTAGWRQRFSHCLYLNPTDPRSAAYNPLLEVRRGTQEVRDVQNIADVLVDPEGALEKRNHWEKTSHSLLVGTILHVLYAGEDKTLCGVANFLSDPEHPFEHTLKLMMTTPHLGARGVHPVVASSAREVLNKSENERSGVLSTAMSFLGLYRDPTVAAVTSRCDWRIADLVAGEHPVSLYLVVPPSDISPHQATDPAHPQSDRPAADREPGEPGRGRAQAPRPVHARRVPGARAPRLLRVRARLHGGLWPPLLPDRAVAQPNRESLRAEQLDPRQLPRPYRLRVERRAHRQADL